MDDIIMCYADFGLSALIIGAAVALGGTIAGIYNSNKTNRTNKQIADEQNAFNEKMQDKQNEYNSYSNQMAMMEDAGLNPAFLFGQNAPDATQPSAVTSAGLPQMQSPDTDLNAIARNLFEAKKLQNETMKTEVDVNKTIQESETYRIANKTAEDRANAEISEIRSRTGVNEEQRNLLIQNVETEKAKQQEIFYNAENLRYNTQLLQQKAYTEKWSQEKLKAEITRVVKITPLEAKEIQSRTHLNEKQAALVSETTNKVNQEIINLIKSGSQIDAVTVGQIIKNQVDDLKANNEISAELMKSESGVLNLIYDSCNGMIGDAIKALASYSIGFTMDDNKRSHKAKIKKQRTHSSPSSSWLFE